MVHHCLILDESSLLRYDMKVERYLSDVRIVLISVCPGRKFPWRHWPGLGRGRSPRTPPLCPDYPPPRPGSNLRGFSSTDSHSSHLQKYFNRPQIQHWQIYLFLPSPPPLFSPWDLSFPLSPSLLNPPFLDFKVYHNCNLDWLTHCTRWTRTERIYYYWMDHDACWVLRPRYMQYYRLILPQCLMACTH